MKKICVYCGSNSGTSPEYIAGAKALGEQIAKNNLELVYGGSALGLMGAIADTVMEHGGKATGVIPTGLFAGEVVHPSLTELIEVKDMHERKATMSDLADAYIAMPGGFGTFEELFEVICWSQLGIHHKPIGILNTAGYYTPLLEMIDHSVQAGFVKEVNKKLIVADSAPAALIQKIKEYKRPEMGVKWNLDQ